VPPTFFGSLGELEHHGERSLVFHGIEEQTSTLRIE